jgi:ATP-dependent RNA helicase DDX49/DBP8
VLVLNNEKIMSKFENLGVSSWLIKSLNLLSIKEPTEIQEQCIPMINQGKNVIGIAKTGSGKTACFVLPILQKLILEPFGVYALIITPTRELAYQIEEQFKAIGTGTQLRISTIVGGLGKDLIYFLISSFRILIIIITSFRFH